MNLRLIAYSIILIILGTFIINNPDIYYVWGYISIACSFFFAGLGISEGINDERTSKIVKYSGICLSVVSVLILLGLYHNDLSYIFN
jgi:hypothetical protein